MPLSFLSSLIGGGAGLGFTGSSTNTNSNTNYNQNTNTSNAQNTSGSQSQVLTPYQQALQSPLFTQITNAMTPAGAEATVAPYTAASRDATSSTYGGLADTLRQQFMSTGNGQSGKFGTALVQGNLQRLGALQGVDTTGQQEAEALPLQASSLAAQLLGQNMGQTSTASTSGTTAGSTTGASSTATKSSTSGFSL